jgi:hypothetical protein
MKTARPGCRSQYWFPYHGLLEGTTVCLPTYHRRVDMHTYILLYDPTPPDQGGYLPGARFGAHEISNMLNCRNFGALPNDAILEHEGQRYQVQEKFDHHTRLHKQRLILLKD